MTIQEVHLTLQLITVIREKVKTEGKGENPQVRVLLDRGPEKNSTNIINLIPAVGQDQGIDITKAEENNTIQTLIDQDRGHQLGNTHQGIRSIK